MVFFLGETVFSSLTLQYPRIAPPWLYHLGRLVVQIVEEMAAAEANALYALCFFEKYDEGTWGV